MNHSGSFWRRSLLVMALSGCEFPELDDPDSPNIPDSPNVPDPPGCEWPHPDDEPAPCPIPKSVTLFSDEVVAYEHLGFSVAAADGSVAIGAKDSNRAGAVQSGAVVVFARDPDGAWRQSDVLTSHEAEAGDNFGFSIALSGKFLAVGAPFSTVHGVQTGAVYIFERNIDGHWTESAILSPPHGHAFDLVGYSIAIDGERIIIGAFQAGDEHQGAAFVYERDGFAWRLDAALQADDGVRAARFGSSVAILGNRVLIGAPSDSHLAPAAGSAYVFERDARGWHQKFKLMAEDAARADFFGSSVALSQNTAAVGAPYKMNGAGSAVGAVYVFREMGAGWERQRKIVPPDAASGDAFGISISLLDNVLAIGSPRNDDAGSIYVYQQEEDEWRQLRKLQQSESLQNNEYGLAVMLSDDGSVVAGAWLAGSSEPETGAVEISELPCSQRWKSVSAAGR